MELRVVDGDVFDHVSNLLQITLLNDLVIARHVWVFTETVLH